jgi:hypothetical protein
MAPAEAAEYVREPVNYGLTAQALDMAAAAHRPRAPAKPQALPRRSNSCKIFRFKQFIAHLEPAEPE